LNMDFHDSFEEAAFREEVKSWLKRNATDFDVSSVHGDIELVALGKSWQYAKAAAGYSGIAWPRNIGGRGGTPIEAAIFDDEERHYPVPLGAFVNIGLNMAVPVVNRHGTFEQADRFTRPTLLGQITWCQLFSEPDAGSDLAALRSRAVQSGDGWTVNGQKVWSSWAHTADFGILLARTDASVAKHKGLTFFVVDMKTSGIDVRPIRQISGKSEFSEVFLENVFIPDENRIGAVGEGWACAMTTLMSERIGAGHPAGTLSTADLIEIISLQERAPTGIEKERIAQWRALEMGEENFRRRLLTDISRGRRIGVSSSIIKLSHAKMLQEMSAFAMDIEGMQSMITDASNTLRAKAEHSFFWGAVLRIAGGADEVLRNQIAERVLGMPGEIRHDKDTPFDKIGQLQMK